MATINKNSKNIEDTSLPGKEYQNFRELYYQASKSILKKIQERGLNKQDQPEVPNKALDDNYVGRLQELTVQRGLTQPDYQYSQRGSAHEPVFECRLQIMFKGEVRIFRATASAKKQAKQNVAEICLKEIMRN